jgi:predicted small lipoprotein YifL
MLLLRTVNKVHMHSRLPLYVAMALTLAVMLSISGCGVRGSLEAPPGAKTEVGKSEPGTPGEPVPHKPFILDSLLR